MSYAGIATKIIFWYRPAGEVSNYQFSLQGFVFKKLFQQSLCQKTSLAMCCYYDRPLFIPVREIILKRSSDITVSKVEGLGRNFFVAHQEGLKVCLPVTRGKDTGMLVESARLVKDRCIICFCINVAVRNRRVQFIFF